MLKHIKEIIDSNPIIKAEQEVVEAYKLDLKRNKRALLNARKSFKSGKHGKNYQQFLFDYFKSSKK